MSTDIDSVEAELVSANAALETERAAVTEAEDAAEATAVEFHTTLHLPAAR